MAITFSYAKILYAIGQVLDQIGAKGIGIREEEDVLLVEGRNSEGQLSVQNRYTIADLYNLVSRLEDQEEGEPVTVLTTGSLNWFLAEHGGGSGNREEKWVTAPTTGLLRQFLDERNRELVEASPYSG